MKTTTSTGTANRQVHIEDVRGRAATKEEYVAAWNEHIQELQSVASDRYWNDVENYGRWTKLQSDLKALVAEAADICFDRDDPRNPAK